MRELEVFDRRLYSPEGECSLVRDNIDIGGQNYSAVYHEEGNEWSVSLGRSYPTNSEVCAMDESYRVEELPENSEDLAGTLRRLEKDRLEVENSLEPAAAD